MAKKKKCVERTTLPSGYPEAYADGLTFVDARNAFYLASDPRRRIDNRNGNQINNDCTAFANCPEQGFQRYFPGARS